jgi:hypothetical protein
MYRRYYNEYEKRAQQLVEAQKNNQEAVKSTQQRTTGNALSAKQSAAPAKTQNENPKTLLGKFRIDDVLLIMIILLLLKENKKDMGLILALGFIFICDFNL